MQRFAWLALCGAVLSGCNYTVYHQPGKTIEDRDRDLVRCEVRALREAPVATEIRYHPPVKRERKICDHKDRCITDHYWTDPEPYTVDVNERLRVRVKEQCMLNKGYNEVTLPRCERGQPVAVPARMTGIAPNACIYRGQSGKSQVATPQ
ncbi:hypothetical protein [Thalassobius sp. Cn5-15]|uniref:hypothetical protein n=1 Tax=Thalassobius sp. Cn5-15 TaxID=2917763 RepID=UPI001EF2349F|nr:hypothetical protein [Thalassobius sp. Cn5-15]MCG7492187.1 hypothetical protein [Thalassobius sp. Cn5-15]